MSKRNKPTGKKLKNLSDPKLAQPHKKGLKIRFILTSLDTKWGRFSYNLYYRHHIIFEDSLKYYKKTTVLLNKCRKLEVNKDTRFREIPDILRNKLEINSMKFLILFKLGLEYLVSEYQPIIKNIKEHRGEIFCEPSPSKDLGNRLKILKDAIGLKEEVPNQIYILLDRRDIIEHPTKERLSEGSKTGWKTINLSWILCGEVDGIINPIIGFINKFVEKMETYKKDNPIPGKLTGVRRGIKAGEQYKKSTN